MPDTPADPRKSYHHGDLKNALVEAGLEILEADGLPGLTLRAIAARAGVSHTAPKNHFGSLRGLLTAIAAEGFRRHAAFMRDGLDPASDRPARLRAAMNGYVRFARKHPALFELMFSPVLCDTQDPALRAAGAESYSILADIAQGLTWDKGRGADAQTKTEVMLWSFVHGYAKLLLSNQLPADADGSPLFTVNQIIPGFGYE